MIPTMEFRSEAELTFLNVSLEKSRYDKSLISCIFTKNKSLLFVPGFLESRNQVLSLLNRLIGWGCHVGLIFASVLVENFHKSATTKLSEFFKVEITKSTIWKKTEAATLRPHRHSTHLGTTHSPCTFRAHSPENSAHSAMKTYPFRR